MGELDSWVCPKCFMTWTGPMPMPDVCLKCYVLHALDMKDFKVKIKITEYLLTRDRSDDE